MLRLIIAAVLACACLAYPHRRDGPPADMANLKAFGPGGQAMPGMAPEMQGVAGGMAPGQFVPFNPNLPNLGFGYKRAADENLEKRKHHAEFNSEGTSKENFDGAPGNLDLENFDFAKFLSENDDSHPFADVESPDASNLDNFDSEAEQGPQEGHYRFFDKQE